MMTDPLIRMISIPFLAGLVCIGLPGQWEKARAWLSVTACAITLLIAVLVLVLG